MLRARCPHCQTTHIGVLARLWANDSKPVCCPSCGGLSVPQLGRVAQALLLTLGGGCVLSLLAAPLSSNWQAWADVAIVCAFLGSLLYLVLSIIQPLVVANQDTTVASGRFQSIFAALLVLWYVGAYFLKANHVL